MTVRMYHPVHGWTHAYTEGEVKELEKQGWKPEQAEQPKRKTREKK